MAYTDTAAMMVDPVFLSRVKVSCLNFANYIVGEAPTVTAHTTRYKWAQQCFSAPDGAAVTCMPVVVLDPNVQSAGTAITDAALQTAVEDAINKMI